MIAFYGVMMFVVGLCTGWELFSPNSLHKTKD